jgi:hypothetical protein
LSHIKRSIIDVKAEENCLAHALIISIARLTNDTNYNSYRRGYKIRGEVDRLLAVTGIDLTNGAGIPELTSFQDHLKKYRIVVFAGLNCEDIMFDGHLESENRINLLYDKVLRHFHVIGNLTGGLSRKYVCKGCNRGCDSGVTHKCQETCSDCMSDPPWPSPTFESRAPNAIYCLKVAHVLTNIIEAC